MADTLQHIINHVFIPPKLPLVNDQTPGNNHALVEFTHDTALAYREYLEGNQRTEWAHIVRMLKNLQNFEKSGAYAAHELIEAFGSLQAGDVLVMFVREQNASVMFRKSQDKVLYESFEASPASADVLGAPGKLRCSFPGPCISIPLAGFEDPLFRKHLSIFLAQMNTDVLDSSGHATKAGTSMSETRDSAHPHYITELLTGILRGADGTEGQTNRICKRVADEALGTGAGGVPWRRSSLWSTIRVALQTTLYRHDPTHTQYKSFMAFLMAKAMLRACNDFGSDLLHCMRAKVARRAFKMGDAMPEFLPAVLERACEQVQEVLDERWSAVQEQQAQLLEWNPSQLNLEQDTKLLLSHSKDAIRTAMNRPNHLNAVPSFSPDEHRRIRKFYNQTEESLRTAFAVNGHVALADFETSVRKHVDSWAGEDAEQKTKVLHTAMAQYSAAAQRLYKDNPEDQSLMILTLLDLWVALDQTATEHIEILGDYSPEIPLDIAKRLLLRKSEHLQRLDYIIRHLEMRYNNVRYKKASVFSDVSDKTSFAVRYYEGSDKCKQLQQRIERQAQREKDKVLKELEELTVQYNDYMARAARHEHSNHETRHEKRRRKLVAYIDTDNCRRCNLEKDARELSIGVHEWPLPDTSLKAKAVVFELRCPPVFVRWRAATYLLLHDICTPADKQKESGGARPALHLKNYADLYQFVQDSSETIGRITLASSTQSSKSSFWGGATKKLPTTPEEVCVPHGAKWRIYDDISRQWAIDPFENWSIKQRCTLTLPKDEQIYKGLQYAVEYVSHTQNQVLASQSDCSRDLSLHEFIAYGSLRCGGRLQWLNIARELAGKNLTFHRSAVHILLMSAAWQVGTYAEGGELKWHEQLASPEFGKVLLGTMEVLLDEVAGSWKEVGTVRTISLLTSRLLAAVREDNVDVRNRAYQLLRRARTVAHGWLEEFVEKLQTCDEMFVKTFQQRICEIAATCRSTYDVDEAHVSSLIQTTYDVNVFIQCGIVIYDNSPIDREKVSGEFKWVLDRDRRLAHFIEPEIHHMLRSADDEENDEEGQFIRDGLDQAIRSVWSAFRPGTSWEAVDAPNDRWLTCQTGRGPGNEQSQVVHLNLLDGRLLVNGQPLGRLPKDIIKHSLYVRLFGNTKVLDVIPADLPGMQFATRTHLYESQVFFALQADETLVVRASRGNKLFEVIPHTCFSGDLPTMLVEDFVHWLNVTTGEIELRPLEKLWFSSPAHWRLQFSDAGSRMRGENSQLLVDVGSPTFAMIANRLRPLEYDEFMTVTSSHDFASLGCALPRFRLSFFRNSEDELECQNLPSLIVDANQSPGTFFGLNSQLVLRQQSHITFPNSRRILVPVGDIKFHIFDNHVNVNIDTKGNGRNVQYHQYVIDTDLGRLVGTVSLECKLYKVYLHAVTSHCLPDPLTGKTGTEEALQELSSAGCLSFQHLRLPEIDLLSKIAALTPKRVLHPPRLEVMQAVSWISILPTSQHREFRRLSRKILEHAQALLLFRDEEEEAKAIKKAFDNGISSERLLDRAASFNSMFYPADIASMSPVPPSDVAYSSRDCKLDVEPVIYHVASMVFTQEPRLSEYLPIYDTLKEIDVRVSGTGETSSLAYNRDWFRPKMTEKWLSLYKDCSSGGRETKFAMLFSFAAMAYGSPENRKYIPYFVAFSREERFRSLQPPTCSSYHLGYGKNRNTTKLSKLVVEAARPLHLTPSAQLTRSHNETEDVFIHRRRKHYEKARNSQAAEIVKVLARQWPCRQPVFSVHNAPLFYVPEFLESTGRWFQYWFDNNKLHSHFGLVQDILEDLTDRGRMAIDPSVYTFQSSFVPAPSVPTFTSMSTLLSQKPATPAQFPPLESLWNPSIIQRENVAPSSQLRKLLLEFRDNGIRQKYGRDLRESQKAYEQLKKPVLPTTIPHSVDGLLTHRAACTTRVEELFNVVRQSLSPKNTPQRLLQLSGQWPRITRYTVLRLLSLERRPSLLPQWTTVLTRLALSILEYQRSQRLLQFYVNSKLEDFIKELENWEFEVRLGEQYPDWLLIQAESGFHARPLQCRVAQEMMEPQNRQNTVLQLNMGEGKSSVITPMVAAALADGSKLVRVVVLKALSTQMFQLLVERLSGLANRRLFYLPFSRSVDVAPEDIQQIRDLYLSCMRDGGILIAQPEHILSFKLMAIHRLLESPKNTQITPEAQALLEAQLWESEYSRDILDESDEILHVKYQLVYTVGHQRPVEDSPSRWKITQEIFQLTRLHIQDVKDMYLDTVEVQCDASANGGFPMIRILHRDPGDALVHRIAGDIINKGCLSNLNIRIVRDDIRKATFRFITQRREEPQDTELLLKHFADSGAWNTVLLLRGLLAHGILVYSLQHRRYRVDYGLDPSRTMLAVPYRAKDVPSLRAEFGHPDVAIVLTCLSYYLNGLTPLQVALCFELLFKLDNPAHEYDLWVSRSVGVPDILQRINGINTEDKEQHVNYLVPLFRCNQAVVDFFLSNVVFPKAAKEFPEKLSSSGWDLAASKKQITTGFSGTNDNRYLLPTSIHQPEAKNDPIQQNSTNAQVLHYLLRPENAHYKCAQGPKGEHLPVDAFLDLLAQQQPEIRVLLDVGAQMLDKQNKELVQAWLRVNPAADAAIFFNEVDELSVLARDGTIEPFMSSPFKQQLEKCLVYLDDAHTRGTDLKLPRDYRAAVTLGAKVTKDRLVQGCMRMRQLGHGQLLMFFAPQEVDRAMRLIAGKMEQGNIEVVDILRWSLNETCADIEHHLPHWAHQGADYVARKKALERLTSSGLTNARDLLVEAWVQPEARTLKQLYGVDDGANASDERIFAIPELAERLKDLGKTRLDKIDMDEEQEREVSHEVEVERQIERPPKAEPVDPEFSGDLTKFIRSGTFNSGSAAFLPLFHVTGHRDKQHWSQSLYATKDFAQTIEYSGEINLSEYHKPLNWILSGRDVVTQQTVIIALGPHEVNKFLPEIYASQFVHLHTYAPKVIQGMRTFDDLQFFSIPPLPETWTPPNVKLICQLNLFAGQLYISSYQEYLALCNFLGLHSPSLPPAEGIMSDGFVPAHARTELNNLPNSPFTRSPVQFLKRWFGLRRKGQSFYPTHLGKILNGRPLSDQDFARV